MFKKILRSLIVWLLTAEAKLVLRKYRPRVVGITGSVGKTSAKDAVSLVLASCFVTRGSEKSFNSEIGIPLSILGRPNAWGRPIDWLKNLLVGLNLIIFSQTYPEWLVLEIGVDRPGDIERLKHWLMLDIALITSLPALPAHLEAFSSATELQTEKLSIFQALKPNGWAIANGDDELIILPKNKSVLTYGFGPDNALKAHDAYLLYEDLKICGYTFKLDYSERTIPVRLSKVVGQQQIYAILAGLAVGLALKLNLVDLVEILTEYLPPPGRMRLLPGVKDTLILDDSYNASPVAVEAALLTLKSLKISGRRFAVIGDMMELGVETVAAHQKIGWAAAASVDYLITVGVRAKFINEAVREKGFDETHLEHFDEARAAGRALEHLLAPGDLVLVKGSQFVRLERAVEEIMAEPERKAELLCRQEIEWQER